MEQELKINYKFSFCNITSTFSGIGHIIVDVNGVISTALKTYSLDVKQCPIKTIYLHFSYLVENLKKFQLRDLLFFYEYTGCPYFDLIIDTLNNGSFIHYSRIKDSLENKRIAIALSTLEREDLKNFFAASGLYLGLVDMILFEIPYASTVVFNPDNVVDPDAVYNCSGPIDYANSSIELTSMSSLDLEKRLEEIREDFFNFDLSISYISSNFVVNQEIVNFILHKNSTSEEKIFFDGRIFEKIATKQETDESVDRSIFDLKIEKPWSGKDLELVMNPVPDKVPAKHLANIRRSALSLFDGKFHFSSLIREQPKSEKPAKVSAKMKKIIEENEARIRREKEQVDNIWLKNFYSNYMKIPNLRGKKIMLENLKINNDFINKRLLLLKIELYSDIWNLERRSDPVDEKVLVPLYLACLNYIDNYVTEGSYNKDELEFVMIKLVDAGFEATSREILEKLKIELDLPYKTKASSAPNDVDLYFQLKYAGDHLKRTLGTRKDKRVPFDPDKWQVELLDAVDSEQTAIVAAPTSSGKTFICFYAIEKVLRASDTDVVVFCLPTKALVNQVTADIYARFNPKNCKTVLQGSLMPDKSNDPFNCQVLITIPSMLESLLIKNEMNIKYIIIDEVHKINDSSLGLRIERAIHLAKCPLLLLSATLGNLNAFYNWVKNIENSKGRECKLVVHNERFCELKTFVYTEKKFIENTEDEVVDENDYKDIQIKPALVPINNMFAYSFAHLKEFGFGNDLHFLPEELLNIYYYIYMILDQSQKKLIKNLAPKKFFSSNIISKADVKQYQNHLLSTFETWVQQGILNEDQVLQIHSLLTSESHKAFNFDTSEKYIADNILKLLNTLKDSNMLPVIVFNTDRDFVTKLAKIVYEELENQDIKKKKDKQFEKMKKEAKRNRDAEKTKDSWIEESIASEQMVEPEQRDIRFTFLDKITKLTDYEVKEELADIKGIPKEILDMAYRGIGIHHDSMNRKYRAAVEILFRKKHIRVLFATQTLALGINMPCRTVVFAGDSLKLDPMNYKQMSGRAGRRGYDTLGNVVFFGIPKNRVQNLMVSMLPEIQGVYTYSNSSLVSFKIEDSIIANPLLNAGIEYNKIKELSEKLEAQHISEPIKSEVKPQVVLDCLSTAESRKSIVGYQKSIYPFIYPSTYLWDLFVSNREFDPSVFLFALMFESNVLSWSGNDLMCVVAHLFEVRPVYEGFEYTLAPLPEKISSFIENVNKIYLKDVCKFYPTALKNLQALTDKPLINIKSFIYNLKEKKNSFLVDFFTHGSSVKIRRNNMVPESELWIALNNIDNFFKSLKRLLETYYEPSDDRLRKLNIIYKEFHEKFDAIGA